MNGVDHAFAAAHVKQGVRRWLRGFLLWNFAVFVVAALCFTQPSRSDGVITFMAVYVTLFVGPVSYAAWKLLRFAFG